MELLQYISQNKEWIFSGIGITSFSFIIWSVRKFKNKFFPKKIKSSHQNIVHDVVEEKVLLQKTTETQKISDRLNQFLGLLNQEKDNFTIAKLAKIMGLKSVGELEQYFLNKEPDFLFIKEFCQCFSVNEDWLLEGKGQPFESNETPIYYDPYEYLEYFQKKKPHEIYFVIAKSKIREAFFILKYNDWQYEIIQRQWHISGYVGGGGSRQLYGMFCLIDALRNINSIYTHCWGCELKYQKFKDLYEGKIFPSHLLSNNSHWWDDLTDVYHKYPIAKNYLEWYGESFIDAQHIIRSQLEMRT